MVVLLIVRDSSLSVGFSFGIFNETIFSEQYFVLNIGVDVKLELDCILNSIGVSTLMVGFAGRIGVHGMGW